MQFKTRYYGQTQVDNRPGASQLSFAPDTLRPPTFFSGELAQSLPFREAISALHDVVVSDLRFKPKDRSAYQAWLAENEAAIYGETLANLDTRRQQLGADIQALRAELTELYREKNLRWQPFYQAQSKYFNYLYKKDLNAWFVLDPVITVHPDELFFECFSQDESSYGRLGVDYQVFKQMGDFACGTTNIDYSAGLYDAFQKIRSYKTTRFAVDAAGFDVQTTHEVAYREQKIDLPDSWVRGFLQVNSAMTLPMISFDLAPMELHQLCFILRRYKEIQGPRAMIYRLRPGEPVRVCFQPWNYEVVCHRSIYTGPKPETIKVWGRRRLHILERLIPLAKKFTVKLLGNGLPSFYLADLGPMSFTLGLSGWTQNDWSRAGHFDLMAPRAQVDAFTQTQVFEGLKKQWLGQPDTLAHSLGLERAQVLGALGIYAQAGQVMYDLVKNVYRVRELSREPLPMEKLRFASPRDAEAQALLQAGKVEINKQESAGDTVVLEGQIDQQQTRLVIDADARMVTPTCSCNFFQQHRLFQGPCAHMLALRMAYQERKEVLR